MSEVFALQNRETKKPEGEFIKLNSEFARQAHTELLEYTGGKTFPCIGGKAAIKGFSYGFSAFNRIDSNETAAELFQDLIRFINGYSIYSMVEDNIVKYTSFIAAFEQPLKSQLDGAAAFITLLANLHQQDKKHGYEWAEGYSKQIDDPNFAFSVGGLAFFIPLIYKFAASPSRQSETTFVVFNPHAVFTVLRNRGLFEPIKTKIREAQDWVHPLLADHGESSEFYQYCLVDVDKTTEVKEIAEMILSF